MPNLDFEPGRDVTEEVKELLDRSHKHYDGNDTLTSPPILEPNEVEIAVELACGDVIVVAKEPDKSSFVQIYTMDASELEDEGQVIDKHDLRHAVMVSKQALRSLSVMFRWLHQELVLKS